MTNAATARAWIAQGVGEAAVGDHFAAVSTQLDKVAEFGIQPTRVFGFWDRVGGRYSVWSSIGLPVAIAIGPDRFNEFLRGGYEIDEHFRSAPIEKNIPILMGLLSVWNRNILGHATHGVIPYDQRLGRFPAYLQQLQMESNGKHVQLDGSPANTATGPVVWANPAPTASTPSSSSSIRARRSFRSTSSSRRRRPTPTGITTISWSPIASLRASPDAWPHSCGSRGADPQAGRERSGRHSPGASQELFGSRPTSTFLYRHLDPRMLGGLIALYEHKVFTEGAVWDINSFDQWGVDSGRNSPRASRRLCRTRPRPSQSWNSSTAGLVTHLRELRGEPASG